MNKISCARFNRDLCQEDSDKKIKVWFRTPSNSIDDKIGSFVSDLFQLNLEVSEVDCLKLCLRMWRQMV